MSTIAFSAFSYAYRYPELALKELSLTLPQGSFTAITGPSGAGKTTLCLAIAGAVPHYFGGQLAGDVLINSKSTTTYSITNLARLVGSVLQDYETQLVALTVEEEIAFGLENSGTDPHIIAKRIPEVLAMVGLSGFEKREVTALSGGQKQRLSIAAALAASPDILVLDEPASALDPDGKKTLYQLLKEINGARKTTIVVVEHDLAAVMPYTDCLVLLRAGSLLQAGKPEEVLRFMWNNQEYMEAVPALWQLKFHLEAKTGELPAWLSTAAAVEKLQQLLAKEAK